MDAIDQAFTDGSLNDEYSIAIQVALDFGKRMMNKYYTLTDESDIYRIALCSFFLFWYIWC